MTWFARLRRRAANQRGQMLTRARIRQAAAVVFILAVVAAIVVVIPYRTLRRHLGADPLIQIIDLRDFSIIKTLKPRDSATSVVFSPNSELLAVADSRGLVRIHRTSDWRVVRAIGKVLTGKFPRTCYVAFSADGTLLASTGYNGGTVRLWDVASWHLIRELKPGRPSGYESGPIAFSPDGRWLTGCEDEGISFWQTSTGRLVRTMSKSFGASSVSFSVDGDLLAAGPYGGDYTVRVWSTASGTPVATMPGTAPVHFLPNGSLFHLSRGPMSSGPTVVPIWRSPGGPLRDRLKAGSIRVVTVSEDAGLVALGLSEVSLYDTANAKLLAKYPGNGFLVSSADFSPDGRFLVLSFMRDVPRLM